MPRGTIRDEGSHQEFIAQNKTAIQATGKCNIPLYKCRRSVIVFSENSDEASDS